MGLCCLWADVNRLLSGWVGILIAVAIVTTAVILAAFLVLRLCIRWRGHHLLAHLRKPSDDMKRPIVVGFFHPYCNAGGGGERVLWTALRALQDRYSDLRCVIYTGDCGVTPVQILQTAKQRFGITLPRTNRGSLEFVYLRRRGCVEAARYPVLTLLGQALGSIVLGLEALFSFVPDVYIDTMGYAFTLPLFRYLGGCRTAAYVHYPTVSTDMLSCVREGTCAHNNARVIARSRTLSAAKLAYYRLFAWAYGAAGRCCDVVMANSTWTRSHMSELWQIPVTIVYPPCDVNTSGDSITAMERKPDIVSVAQFRPEKQHALQLKAFRRFLNEHAIEGGSYRLILIGGCRDSGDEARVEELRQLSRELRLEDRIKFELNIPFEQLQKYLAEATIGLHTMWNEHFGISVVECMLAGAIVLAHNSAGPKLDIVIDVEGQPTGFLADDEKSYAAAMSAIFAMSASEQQAIRQRARKRAEFFSETRFESMFVATIQSLICE